MEFLKRKVESEREENQEHMTVSVIDNCRLSLRWAENSKEDVMVNLTAAETKKLKDILSKWQN